MERREKGHHTPARVVGFVTTSAEETVKACIETEYTALRQLHK